MSSAAVQTMLDVLNIEQLEVNLFRGRSPQDRWQRVFGGQVIGQALVAATRMVEGRSPHSLHLRQRRRCCGGTAMCRKRSCFCS